MYINTTIELRTRNVTVVVGLYAGLSNDFQRSAMTTRINCMARVALDSKRHAHFTSVTSSHAAPVTTTPFTN